MRQMILSRCETFILRQKPFSNARRAAFTARSTSSGPASGTVVSCSPVAGFRTGMVLRDTAASHFPSMKSLNGFRACLTSVVFMGFHPALLRSG